MSALEEPHCLHCKSKERLKLCTRCRAARFCGRDCQEKAWPSHKRVCKPAPAPAPAPAPVSSPWDRKVPEASRLPSGLRSFDFVPSVDGANTNLLLLFHGLGDRKEPFTQLARSMKLPQTAVLIPNAPSRVLEMDEESGYSWYTAFDQEYNLIAGSATERRRLSSLARTRSLLSSLLDYLTRECGWPPDMLFLMGFSQGGEVAFNLASHYPSRLGGIVCCSSALMPEHYARFAPAADATVLSAARREVGQLRGTPLLVTHGTLDERVSVATAERHVALIRAINSDTDSDSSSDRKEGEGEDEGILFRTFPKGHAMLSSRDEAEAVYGFLGKRLALRALQLERDSDVIELSGLPPGAIQQLVGKQAEAMI